eukprot:scaffold55465_cov33-Attheya_sp.AAC.1
MGNSSSSPSAFATDTIFKNKEDLVRAANVHNHGVGSGDWKNFKKKEYESVCCGFIKAHPVKKKKLSLHNMTGAFCITSSSAHSCIGTPITSMGSRSVPHQYKILARLAHNTSHTNPHIPTRAIGNIVEEKLKLSANTMSYQQHYKIKQACDSQWWGDVTHQYGCIVNMLEIMKEYDPEYRIFLKNKTEYKRNKLGTSLKSSPQFALRFGAVAVTLGSTASVAIKLHFNAHSN